MLRLKNLFEYNALQESSVVKESLTTGQRTTDPATVNQSLTVAVRRHPA
jgi:hypothetical protein